MYQRLCTSSFNIIHEEINYIWIITVKYKALCSYKPCHFIIILIIIMFFVTTLTCLWRQRNFKKWLLGHWVFICPCVQHSIINAQLLNNFCFLCIICLEWLYQKERVAWGYDYTVYKSYLCPTHDQHPVLPRHKKKKTLKNPSEMLPGHLIWPLWEKCITENTRGSKAVCSHRGQNISCRAWW